ncbi:MAG: glutathione S-transferase [Myxococcales bacterium]|nr:glutathione S-transferase [Myxococcales bacterium]
MSDTIVFFHNPMSRARVVHWMLEEVGAPYEAKLLSFEKAEHKNPDYLAINPMGKVPAIVHRGVVVTETAAILAYLADAFPAAGLAPALSDPQRGTYLRWLFFAAGCVEPAVTDKMFDRPPVERKGSIGYGSYEDTINALEKAIAPGPFICGDRFTAADVYVASLLGWGMMTKGVEPRPSFAAYVKRATDRPAYQRFVTQGEAFAAKLKG